MSSQSSPGTSVLRALRQWNTKLHPWPCLHPALWAGTQLSQLLKLNLDKGSRTHVFPWHKFCFTFVCLNLHLCCKTFLEELPDRRKVKSHIQVPALSSFRTVYLNLVSKVCDFYNHKSHCRKRLCSVLIRDQNTKQNKKNRRSFLKMKFILPSYAG